MKSVLLYLVLAFLSLCTGLEPLSTSLIVGSVISSSLIYSIFDEKIKCQFSECCSTPFWLPLNVTKFEDLFDAHVFGQHIVKKVVSKALKSHLRKGSNSKKALVLSFHGWTGTGKNYVAKFVAESLYHLGLRSQFTKVFISTVHFPDSEKVDLYKIELQKIIMETVKNCPQALFIFDEVDKLPFGLVDAIKPFIDYHDNVQGLDFRQSIFIFLSNTGGKSINELTLEAWQNGLIREKIQYSELEILVKNGAFNELGGLHQSAVIDKHLVDWFVPFLPLERKHVAQCVIAAANDRNSTVVLKLEEIESILDELVYTPNEYLIYSATGCKTVLPKVDALLEDIIDE